MVSLDCHQTNLMNYYKYALFAFLIFLLLPWTVSSGEKKLPKIEIKPNIWGGASTRDIQKILNSQASREERLGIADEVILNNSSIEFLKEEVLKVHKIYMDLVNE